MKTPVYLAGIFLCGLGTGFSYELHEWGTFTTVSGSDGILLSGLQREEEVLPAFVHSHFGLENGQTPSFATANELLRRYGRLWPITPEPMATKGFGKRPVTGVTVKMETPVIYFHSKEGFRAKVNVGFNGGSISQWYPRRSGGESLPLPAPRPQPLLNPIPPDEWQIDFSKNYQGSISWEIDVLSPVETRNALLFKPLDTVNWMRARVPEANAVRTGKETEGYLFYRGIGNFNPALETKIDGNESLHLHNHTGGDIPYLLVYERKGALSSWYAVDEGLKKDAGLEVEESRLSAPPLTANPGETGDGSSLSGSDVPLELYASMKSGLTRTGLLASEADAMIQTWWRSYFEAQGLRIFWILPRQATDRILPLSVEPAPAEIVRVIVGRSEILRPRQEQQWLRESKLAGADRSGWGSIVRSDRFGLAIKQRIDSLHSATSTTTPADQNKTASASSR